MKISISKIRVVKRIRKDVTKIGELAEDIRNNGLINPIAVMMTDGGEYQLLAGLRRLRAVELNGETEIEANAIPAADAEAALKIEFSENEQREPFTYSEKMEYTALLDAIEREKAKERMSEGGRNKGLINLSDLLAEKSAGIKCGNVDAIVAPKIGMSEATYRRAKYLANNAPPETIEQLDKGEKSINGAYFELRAAEKAKASQQAVPVMDDVNETEPTPDATHPTAPLAEQPKPNIRAANKAGRETELREQYTEALARAGRAESELEDVKYKQHNEIYHRDCQIENLKNRVAALEAALEAANARIKELEERYEPAGHTD